MQVCAACAPMGCLPLELFGGEKLGLANLGDGHTTLVEQLADLVAICINGIYPCGHVRELVTDHLFP